MDLLQNIDIKTSDSRAEKLDMRAGKKPSDSMNLKQNKPFEQQLNEQVDQLRSTSDVGKSNANQADRDSMESSSASEAESIVEADTLTDDSQQTQQIDSVQTDKNLLQDDDTSLPVIGAGLPVTGIELPLLTSLTGKMNAQLASIAGANQVTGTSVNSPAIDSLSSAEADNTLQLSSDILNKVMTQSALIKGENVSTETAVARPSVTPLNTSGNFTEKANFQDVKSAKVVSEMPTTDIISQASKLQQVPMTTAAVLSSSQYSSSLALIQNATSASSETTSIISNPLSANLAPLSQSPIGSAGLSITANVQNPNWSQQMTQQVSYMVSGNIQQAEIKLNPAHLGPMEIKLSMNDDQATVNFVTQHAAVRDALDAALPRLKEMLEQQGLNLAGADVSTQSEQQSSAEAQQGNAQADDINTIENEFGEEATSEKITVNLGTQSGLSIFA